MENQEIMDQFLENRQNYLMDNNSMQHMNVASAGCDAVVGGGVQGDVSGGVAGEILGVKCDEQNEQHDVGDDEEWKYVKEVQQSEKQQQQQLQALKNFGLDDNGTYEGNELAESNEITNNAAHEFGNGDGGFVFRGEHHQQLEQPQQHHHDLFNIGNGHDTNGHGNVNINEDFSNIVSAGFEEKLSMMESEMDGFKNEGDFSSTSNVTESMEGFVPQVDVKIETKPEQHEMVDEEEPSSLATNTTNGTSSLSENVPPQEVVAPQTTNAFDDFMDNLENKENSNPVTPQRPIELELEQGHSLLNPDAKEFIPSFGSNPASPTSPFATGLQKNEDVLCEAVETQMYFGQAPSAVPRHLLGNDELLAQSPRKGKGDNNLDAVALPNELSEFEQEADKRPHELEPENVDSFQRRDEDMTPDQAIQQLPFDDIETHDKENQDPTDSTDCQPSQFMDHGPETCVDLDTDLDLQPSTVLSSLQGEDDVMKRSIYVANDADAAIEDVLNSVQPIPTEIDSVNNSFIEESATESAANQFPGDKELLQVEEKEHVSHSPSTEEIQMNLQNTFNSSNKDIPQLPIDMDNVHNMQESMYMEQEEQLQQQPGQHFEQDKELHHEVEEQPFQEKFQHEQQVEQQHEEFQQKIEVAKQDVLNFVDQQQQEEEQFFQEQSQMTQSEEQPHLVQQEEEPLFELQQQLQEKEATKPQHHDENPFKTEIADGSLLAETTNPLVATDSFLDNSLGTQEQQQEIHESYSPFKINDEVSNAPFSAFEQQQQHAQFNLGDDFNTPSSTGDEKHLLEETKEQQLFSMSGLEQEMSEMMLNNTDSHISQVENVAAATPAATAIEDISENLISPDEAVQHVDDDEYQPHQEPESHEEQEQTMVDDSFQRHEQECQQQYEQEQAKAKEMLFEEVHQQPVAAEPSAEVREFIESPMEQQQLESEMVPVEEPIFQAKQSAPLFSNEETETVNVTKTEEIAEIPEVKSISMVSDTALFEIMVPQTETAAVDVMEPQQPVAAGAELLEPTPELVHNETEEFVKIEKEIIEEPKPEVVVEPVVEELKVKEEESAKPKVVETAETKSEVPIEAVAVAATAAVAATVAAAAVATAKSAPFSKSKTEVAKKPLSKTTSAAAAKPKVGSTPAAKKPIEAAKKPVGLATKPRITSAKPAAAVADKKPIAKTTTTTTTSTTRKPLSATTSATASKVVSKTTTNTTTTRTATGASRTTTSTTRPATAPRTLTATTTTARKPTTSTTNGPLAKPRPTTAPAKPTTLGLSATNGAAPKTKSTSPRPTLASQVRKTTPASNAAKSPVKSTATNGVSKLANTNLTSKTKTTTSTATSTAGKTFTARPAPKFTSSSSTTTTTTTTRRTTLGSGTTASTTATPTKTSTTPLRKSSPTKPAVGRTPIKSTTTTAASKSKAAAAKTASPSGKPAPIRKPADKTVTVTNGVSKEMANGAEQEPIPQNGDLQAVQLEQQQNGDSSIPMQTEQQSLLEPRDDQIPMDLINA